MAILKQRLNRKNSSGGYDTIYLETIATVVKMSETDNTTVAAAINNRLPLSGGTLTGMEELVKEFDGTIAGVCVLCEADFDKEKLINNYLSLVKISKIDTEKKLILAEPGNFLDETDFDRF